MKNLLRIISALTIILALILPTSLTDTKAENFNQVDFRGVWVATVLNIDYPSKATINQEVLKNEALKILDNAEQMGLNAVFLQVRPTSDAIYKSKIFPWSKYLTGSQGQAPDNDFDPLAFWVEEAHKRGIELHAWINPYRITKKMANEPSHDFASLDPSNPALLNPHWVVQHTDGNLYYDPGIPEVRRLVIDGVLEIIENYAIDGIHFDDYFYPGKDFNDRATFKAYGLGYGDINEWRRENVNTLIRDLSTAIKETEKNIDFGISPFGIWANKRTNTFGSETQGMQSYYDQYADTRKWVKEGLLDYIAPQLYWNIGFSIADYSKLLAWWEDTVLDTGVDLYIGQAAYRTGNDDPKSPWYGIGEIEKQLQRNVQSPTVKGSIFFSYKSFENNPALMATVKAIYENRDGIAPNIPVRIAKPSENLRTSLGQFYLYGSSDPNKPLFVNGKLVENQSKQGYFGMLLPLNKGANLFTFSQEGSYVTRIIHRENTTATQQEMGKPEIPPASVFPQSQAYVAPGEKITFSCKAPRGSKVTVKIGKTTYGMKPSSTASNATGLYAETYTYVYTIPTYKGTSRTIDLGTPVYKMDYKGTIKTQKAPGKVGVIMKNAPFYAVVEQPVIYTYQSPTNSGGATYEIYKGMVDYVTGMTGNYARLSSGQWVEKKDVKIYSSKTQMNPKIKNPVYILGERWDTFKLDTSSPAAAIAAFDGTTLKLNISMVSSGTLPVLPKDSLFSKITASRVGDTLQYTLTLKNNQQIDGYHVEKTASGLALKIKRPVVAKGGNGMLSGITIMLDPGHGGSDTGAIGPLGPAYAEKRINLETAFKLQTELEKNGAKVLTTRTTDDVVSLEERLTASRNAKPDLFISIHANSMPDNVDISKVDGFSVFYREKLAQSIAQKVYNNTINTLLRNKKGVHQKNFYVVRGTWAPSILLESGFIPNPNEFEWLIDENEQSRLAVSISEAVVGYFSNR